MNLRLFFFCHFPVYLTRMASCQDPLLFNLSSVAASARSRCSLRSLRHRPAALHRIRDGAELEGPCPQRGLPRTWILPGPERSGHGSVERGQRKTCQREAFQGQRCQRSRVQGFSSVANTPALVCPSFGSLARQMEPFLYLLDLSHLSIW